ncbi:hypothetical protein BDN71DRAFT_1431774 [Pleurotus eryngii]|uniref:Uncharacterized protein n=1 Tax=Pleurotus eryngii TaxID=5323 RepID=A0A9P5ZV40_PLEER|nr:hypothetical protein BDN71DRAFT_1431774 [Pleurotus eryngii]
MLNHNEGNQNILHVVLFGSASLNKPTIHMSTLGKLWGINKLTTASLAFAVIAAIHMLSPDSSLNETGLISLIPYRKYYYKLKSTLVLHADSPSICKAFQMHEVIVFEGITHHSTTSETTNQAPESQNSVNSLCEALRNINSSDDDKSNNGRTHGASNTFAHSRPIEYKTFNLSNITQSNSDTLEERNIDDTPAVPATDNTPVVQNIMASANGMRGGKKKGCGGS